MNTAQIIRFPIERVKPRLDPENWYFDQFTHIHAVMLVKGRLFLQLGLIPAGQSNSGQASKVVIPPRQWVRQLQCTILDPELPYTVRAEIEGAEKQGRYLLLKSGLLHPSTETNATFSHKAQVMLHGPNGVYRLIRYYDVFRHHKAKKA